MAEYSEWLMDLYERQGQRNELLAELEYHVFTLSSGGMEMLDRYEAALKKRYPDEMLEAYARILMKEAVASNRKRYQELARYLKKLRRYPGGAERAARLAEDWRTRYSRRRAMMKESERAGF